MATAVTPTGPADPAGSDVKASDVKASDAKTSDAKVGTSRGQQARQQMTDAAAEIRAAGPLRLGLGTLGILVIAFGGLRILHDHTQTHPIGLAKWLAGAIIVHDFILAPLTVAVGWAVAKAVPGRAQAFVQGGLAVAGVTTLIALPLIYRHGKSAPGTTLLERAYGLNLLIIVVIVALGAVAAYALTARRASRPSSTKQRPWMDH